MILMADGLVAVRQTLLNEQVANVMGFSNVSEDEGELQDLADAIRQAWSANLDDDLTVQWSMDDVLVSFIDNDHISHSIPVAFTGGPLVGTNNGDPLATQNALLITTSYVGPRPNRGRVYIAGLTEGATADGIFTGGVRTSGVNAISFLANGFPIGQTQSFMRIVGRPNDDRPNYVSSPITNVGSHGPVRSQRRRSL